MCATGWGPDSVEAFKAICLTQFLSSLHQQITFQANKRCYYSERMTKCGSASKGARERAKYRRGRVHAEEPRDWRGDETAVVGWRRAACWQGSPQVMLMEATDDCCFTRFL